MGDQLLFVGCLTAASGDDQGSVTAKRKDEAMLDPEDATRLG